MTPRRTIKSTTIKLEQCGTTTDMQREGWPPKRMCQALFRRKDRDFFFNDYLKKTHTHIVGANCKCVPEFNIFPCSLGAERLWCEQAVIQQQHSPAQRLRAGPGGRCAGAAEERRRQHPQELPQRHACHAGQEQKGKLQRWGPRWRSGALRESFRACTFSVVGSDEVHWRLAITSLQSNFCDHTSNSEQGYLKSYFPHWNEWECHSFVWDPPTPKKKKISNKNEDE